jgi:iron complex transport system ATP-binding protein
VYFGFEDIHIAYGDKKVLRGLSADFEKGSITALVGPNGCGKSSLLRILSRGVRPQRGTAWLDGRDIRSYRRRELAQRIAVLPQLHSAPGDIDVRTLISYGRYPHLRPGRRPTPKDMARVDAVMAHTGLCQLADQPVASLSGGERQRAWIALAVCQDPEILVLDEPTTYLDVSHQVDVLEMVRRLNREQGITVMMVLHDLNLAARYADRLCAIKDGVLYLSGSPAEVMTDGFLREVFGVSAHVYEDAVHGCPYFIPERVV